jgi:hypothetical protein
MSPMGCPNPNHRSLPGSASRQGPRGTRCKGKPPGTSLRAAVSDCCQLSRRGLEGRLAPGNGRGFGAEGQRRGGSGQDSRWRAQAAIRCSGCDHRQLQQQQYSSSSSVVTPSSSGGRGGGYSSGSRVGVGGRGRVVVTEGTRILEQQPGRRVGIHQGFGSQKVFTARPVRHGTRRSSQRVEPIRRGRTLFSQPAARQRGATSVHPGTGTSFHPGSWTSSWVKSSRA